MRPTTSGTAWRSALGAASALLILSGCDDGANAGPSQQQTSATPTTSIASGTIDRAYQHITGQAQPAAWADRVAYYLGGDKVATVAGTAAATPLGLTGCPASQRDYAGRDCPISPAATLQAAVDGGESLVLEDQRPQTVGCDKPGRLDLPATRLVVIRPDLEHRDCFSDFAVSLFVDDANEIVAVDVTLSGP